MNSTKAMILCCVLIITGTMTTAVNGHIVNRREIETTELTEAAETFLEDRGSFADLIQSVNDTVRSGARKVQETVQGGIDFIKEKFGHSEPNIDIRFREGDDVQNDDNQEALSSQ